MICTECFQDNGLDDAPPLGDFDAMTYSRLLKNWKCSRCLDREEEAERTAEPQTDSTVSEGAK